MDYNVILNEKEYPLPRVIAKFNKEIFEELSVQLEDKTYLNIEALVIKNRYDNLKRISDQCCNSIGMFSAEDKEEMEEYAKLGPQMRFLDDMAKINYQKGNTALVCQKLLSQMELVLSFYKKQLEKEEMINQSNKTR